MKGKKNFLAGILYYAGFFRLANCRDRSRLTVINYHRIRTDHHFTLFDDEVFGPTQQEFKEHIHWIKTNMDVLSESDLIEFIQGNRKPPARGVLITFDDGYIDNYTLAYPVLRQNALPAIFFIPTLPIEERSLGWWDHAAYLLKMTNHDTIVFEGKPITPKSNIQHAIHYVLTFIVYNYKNVDSILQQLSTVCDVALPGPEIQGKELMTWDQIREVSRNGISIGAHTHSHAILSSLESEKQKDELLRSKQIIEGRVGNNVRSLSYPVGHYNHFTEETKKLAVECGYAMGFSFLTGLTSWDKLDQMNVKRISVSSYLPRFVGEMTVPDFFCELENYEVQ